MIDWFYDSLPGQQFSSELHKLREQGPVVKTTALAGELPIYYIVGHEALSQAFKNGDIFPPGHAYQIISLPFIGETFMSMDEERHRQWRPPMTPSFKRSNVDKMDQGELAAIGHALLDQLEGQSETDLVQSFTRLFAFRVICKQLGLPVDQEKHFYQWSMDIMFGGRDIEKAKHADQQLTAIAREVVEQRKIKSEDDEISRWLNTRVENNLIDEESIYAHIRLFFTAGATTTSDAMSNLFHVLLTHENAWQQCVAEPEKQQGALQELLRWNPPVAAQPRFTHPTEETEFFGHIMPPSSAVLFGVAAANRDPDVFANPDEFDISRNTKTLLSFGPGLRTCPGMHLAQKNLACALKIMAERFPNLRLKENNPEPEGILLRGANKLNVILN